MTLAVVLGAAIGVGLVRMCSLAVRPAPDLYRATVRWDRHRAAAGRTGGVGAAGGGSGLRRLVSRAARELRLRHGDRLVGIDQDLAVTGTTLEAWLGKALVVCVVALVAPTCLLALGNAAGLGLSVAFAPLLGLGLAAVAGVLSVRDLHTEATVRREAFRRALSIYLDLVAMSMEAGRGHAEAIPAAAHIGTGPEFTDLQDAVEGARFAGITPWEALGRLGDRYGLVELVDLRGTLASAQDDGAKIRATLVARAEAMREVRLADAQARAARGTDAMRNLLVLMAIVVIGYQIFPPIMRLVGGG